MRDDGYIDDRADSCSAEARHAQGCPAHHKAVEQRNDFDCAEQADEQEQVDQVSDHHRGNVVRQLLQKLSEGFGVCLRSNSGKNPFITLRFKTSILTSIALNNPWNGFSFWTESRKVDTKNQNKRILTKTETLNQS